MGIDLERLVILRNGIVVPSHLQQQFRVGIVRIGIVRNELNVFLKSLLGVGIVSLLPIGIAEKVECGRIVGSQFGRLFVMFDGLTHLLLAKVIARQREV